MNPEMLSGWVPIRCYWQNGRPLLDWCYLGNHRLTNPVFEYAIEHQLRNPFSLLFRHQTDFDALADLYESSPGLKPAGFIFHISHCGSTLFSRVLGALDHNIVISEPGVLEIAFRTHPRYRLFTDDQRITFMRWLINALGQKRLGNESGYFIKFESYAILDLPLIALAFPDVPWVFLYREPVPVMVSNLRERSGRSLPGAIDPAILGLDLQSVMSMRFEEYVAMTINRMCQAALSYANGKGLLINYTQLPDVIWSRVLPFFGLEYPSGDVDKMNAVSSFNAKQPDAKYVDDTEAKKRQASAFLLEMAEKWIVPVYQELEAKRLA